MSRLPDRLPENLLPELRAKWIKLSGAREVMQHAGAHVQSLESEYQAVINTCFRMLGVDPDRNYRVDLETGAIEEAPLEGNQGQQDQQNQINGVTPNPIPVG